MQKRHLILFLLFLSCRLWATEYGKWIKQLGYVHSNENDIALIAAKNWAESHHDPNKRKFDYLYSISKRDDGYSVALEYRYTRDYGSQYYIFGGHNVLYIDSSGRLEKVFMGR